MISIISLIYKSTLYADSIYNSINEFTPLIAAGQAEFYFIANDATEKLINHLNNKKYRYIVNNNPRKTKEELFNMGYAYPEYLHYVYRGWNAAIESAQDIVVLINSDNIVSPNWLENLLAHLNEKTIVCSQLIERRHPKYGVFPGAYEMNLGKNPKEFNKRLFLCFCATHTQDIIKPGGAYMPCIFYKKCIEQSGYYPEGNLRGATFNEVATYGDAELFRKLKEIGVDHITALNSLSYHFKEGEMEDND